MALDAYLIVMFKKIAQMPPDLNPLEDNLTGQHISKHKHKNSNLSDIGTIINEKRRPNASTVSLSNQSQAREPLIPDATTMPFFQTRNDSSPSFSPHSPDTARIAASPSLHGSVSVANMANAWARDVSAPSTSTRPTHSPAPPSTTASSTSSGLSHPPSLASLQRSYPSSVYSEALDAAMERRMAPLSMHPPTAPDVASLAEPTILEDVPLHNADGSEAGIVRNGTTVVRTRSPDRPGRFATATPAAKRYGDLRAATANIRGQGPAAPAAPASTDAGASRSPDRTYHQQQHQQQQHHQRQHQHAQQREGAGNARVVSRSGVDYADASVLYVDSDVGLARGRDVSGKVAEEGRGWLMRKREGVVGGAA
ncbi:hypothetical protein B0A49_00134 [Cryomyces minteri]|uniref:Uncharacterized protein n=1 Tax=Cryomyces minteri TaxID=331657 RepID=A0A4U0XZ08_9PEZI|nr:hypothetical protein B0A49_00134 [Cryomyces minteri]